MDHKPWQWRQKQTESVGAKTGSDGENTRTRHIFVIKYIKKWNVFKMCLYIMLIVRNFKREFVFPITFSQYQLSISTFPQGI